MSSHRDPRESGGEADGKRSARSGLCFLDFHTERGQTSASSSRWRPGTDARSPGEAPRAKGPE